jgi:ABC-2 type transport system permease protein
MSRSLVRHLIVKDFQLHRTSIVLAIIAGVIGLALIQLKGLAGLLGIIGFFTALIVLGSMIPHLSILNERKGHNLAFLMSLPISMVEYTTAKVLAAFGMFTIPWLVLVATALSLILGRSDVPHGIVPLSLILVTAPLVGFCLMIAIALVGESEHWVMAGTIVVNSGYSFCWPLIISNAELRDGMGSPTPVWSPTALTVLGSEFAAIAVILAITLYLQSRKKDFV